MLGTLTAAYLATKKGKKAGFAKAAMIGIGVDVLVGAGLYALAKNKQLACTYDNKPFLRLDGSPWPAEAAASGAAVTEGLGLLTVRPVDSFGGLSAMGLGYNMARSMSQPRAIYRQGYGMRMPARVTGSLGGRCYNCR